MINVKNCFQINGILQFRLGADGGKTFNKIRLFMINTAYYNIGISDINR